MAPSNMPAWSRGADMLRAAFSFEANRRRALRLSAALLLVASVPPAALAQSSGTSPVGKVGQRKEGEQAGPNARLTRRIESRLPTRINSRISRRIERSAPAQEEVLESFGKSNRAAQTPQRRSE